MRYYKGYIAISDERDIPACCIFAMPVRSPSINCAAFWRTTILRVCGARYTGASQDWRKRS